MKRNCRIPYGFTIRKRLLSILMAVIMTVGYMPLMNFGPTKAWAAEDGQGTLVIKKTFEGIDRSLIPADFAVTVTGENDQAYTLKTNDQDGLTVSDDGLTYTWTKDVAAGTYTIAETNASVQNHGMNATVPDHPVVVSEGAVEEVSITNTYSDPPSTQKDIFDNKDGTRTLSLSVTGKRDSSTTTEVHKANVILVVDTSSSMNQSAANTYYKVDLGKNDQGQNIQPRNPGLDGNTQPTYYGLLNNGSYRQLYYNNGAWYLSNTTTLYTGDFYC